MNFTATCCETSFNADSMAAHLKAEHPRGIERTSPRTYRNYFGGTNTDYSTGHSYTSRTLSGDTLHVPDRLPRVALTKVEKEWLGAYVEGPAALLGRRGQVWAVSGRGKGLVWVVIPNHDGSANEAVEASVDGLRRVGEARAEDLFEAA